MNQRSFLAGKSIVQGGGSINRRDATRRPAAQAAYRHDFGNIDRGLQRESSRSCAGRQPERPRGPPNLDRRGHHDPGHLAGTLVFRVPRGGESRRHLAGRGSRPQRRPDRSGRGRRESTQPASRANTVGLHVAGPGRHRTRLRRGSRGRTDASARRTPNGRSSPSPGRASRAAAASGSVRRAILPQSPSSSTPSWCRLIES